MDLDALADLPPFDEALIPEAMGILGFDMADLPGGAKEAPDDAFDDAQGAKKPKVPGGNQREVQKRYRERKKNYTKDLERKVETLETQLKELIGAKQRADEDDVITLVATGRVVQDDHHPSRGHDDDSAYSTVDASCGGNGGNGAVGECPLEHRRVAEVEHQACGGEARRRCAWRSARHGPELLPTGREGAARKWRGERVAPRARRQ